MRISPLRSSFSFDNKVINKKQTENYINTPSNPIYTTKISFKGSDVNRNQILVLSAECTPYSVSGGLGSVIRDMTEAYKKQYPNKDLRLMLPFYNPQLSFNGPKPLYI